MSIAYLPPHDGPNNWDRAPQPQIAAEINRLVRRREQLVKALGRTLGNKTLGCRATVLKRADRITQLNLAYRGATARIVDLELL